MADLICHLAEAAAYLRQEADFNRSWTDGRRAHCLGEAYDKRRLELTAERDQWADAVQKAIEKLMLGRAEAKRPCGECHLHPDEVCDICGARREHNEMPR